MGPQDVVGLTPTLNDFPSSMKNANDAGTQALAAKMDSLFRAIQAEIIAMLGFKRPEMAPSVVLAELVYMYGASVQPGYTDRQIRQAIQSATRAQRKRGEWAASVKPVIDAITGFSSSLFSGLSDDWPVRQSGAFPNAFGWMTRGAGDVAAFRGIVRTGQGTEPIIAGIVYIDLGDGGASSAATVALVKQAIATDFVPAYFRVFLGYTTAGVFTAYAGGQIN